MPQNTTQQDPTMPTAPIAVLELELDLDDDGTLHCARFVCAEHGFDACNCGL